MTLRKYAMSHKGWHYEVDEDEEWGEVTKLWHYAVHEDGRRQELDLSPYLQNVPQDVFNKLIDLGFPTRKVISSIGPMGVKEVRNLEMEHQDGKR